MARSRRKHVLRPPRRRLTRLGLAASAVLAVGAPAAAIVWSGDEPPAAAPVLHTKSDRARTSAVSMRVATPANTEDLVELVASPEADPQRRTGAAVELRARPYGTARPVDGLESSAVEATGRTKGRWTEVVVENRRVWVRRATVSEAEAPTTATVEKGAAGTRTTQRTDREPDGSGAVTVSRTTAKAASDPQPTATTTTSAAAPTAATTSAPASQPAADTTSEPTASTVQEPTPEPTPVPASTASTDPTDSLAEDCEVTVSGKAVGLRRQLCQLPQ